MDTNLLQKRDPGQPAPKVPGNSAEITPEPAADDTAPAYRELAIESPQPPLRLRFEPPVEYDGKSYKELVFDFDSLIGKDFQYAERSFTKLYKSERNEVVMPEMKHLFHCILAAQVADVPVGLIMKLPRRYYTPLRLEVLKACGSSPDEEKE